MTLSIPQKFNCPLCGNNFESQVLLSTNSCGGTTTELRHRSGGFQPIYYDIHLCPNCGYTWQEDEIEHEPQSKKQELKKYLEDFFKGKPPGKVKPHIKYEVLAGIMKINGISSSIIGEKYILAAWCADDGNLNEKAKYYRAQAVKYFIKELKDKKYSGEPKVYFLYMIGAMYRRMGKFKNSMEYLNKALEETKDPEKKEYIERTKEFTVAGDSGIRGLGENYIDETDRLAAAIMKNDYSEAKKAIKDGADVNEKADIDGRETMLTSAIKTSTMEIVKLLLDSGADVNKTDFFGRTAAHLAIGGKTDLIELLLRYEPDLTIKDKDGDTPLDLARKSKHKKFIEIIEKYIEKMEHK